MQGTYLRSVPRHRGTERSAVSDCILEIWDERGFPSLLLVVDFRTYEIPVGFNLFILTLGLIHCVCHYTNWLDYLIGFLCVSVFLLLLYYVTGGRAIGGGDVKLMAVCGLLLGWKLIIFAFLLGCIIGSVIHLIRMKVSGEGHVLAMGPYLSAGVAIAVLWGNEFLQWYLHFYL